MKTFFLLAFLVKMIWSQCDDSLPDGSKCDADHAGDHADPEECSMFYHCDAQEGCVTHQSCPPNKPLFNDIYRWCMQFEDVECGSRPCNDPELCQHTTLAPTTTSTPDCGHVLDCQEAGDGFWPDPFNCRKYWHCYHGEGEHFICQDDFLFNLEYDGCDYPEYVNCGDRPVCGDCDEDCVYQTTPEPDCGHPFDCSVLPAGYYADPYNCRKYWHCEANYDVEATHFLCPDNFLYDEANVACDYPNYVSCGDRPICGDCDESNCSGCDQNCQG